MRDIVGLLSIALYWFILALMLTHVQSDETLVDSQASFDGNNTNVISLDTSTLNVTSIDAGSTGSVSFLSMLGRILTFRIPQNTSFPLIMINIVEWSNFILVVIFGILLYRQLRSGSG